MWRHIKKPVGSKGMRVISAYMKEDKIKVEGMRYLAF
jgi:hypothetical protein